MEPMKRVLLRGGEESIVDEGYKRLKPKRKKSERKPVERGKRVKSEGKAVEKRLKSEGKASEGKAVERGKRLKSEGKAVERGKRLKSEVKAVERGKRVKSEGKDLEEDYVDFVDNYGDDFKDFTIWKLEPKIHGKTYLEWKAEQNSKKEKPKLNIRKIRKADEKYSRLYLTAFDAIPTPPNTMLAGCPADYPVTGEYRPLFTRICKLALKKYHADNKEVTPFEFDDVVKSTRAIVSGQMYYITFKAKQSSNSSATATIFQAKVWRRMDKSYQVLSCAIKT